MGSFMTRNYRVYIEELDRYVNFVDRDVEIKELLKVIRKGTVFPIAIYGPEGCGKTALLRYIAREVAMWNNVVVVYIDALEQFDLEKALFTTHKEAFEVIQDLLSIPFGVSLARITMAIISRLAKKISLKGKNVVVIVDDVYRAIGIENVDRYTKSLYEWIGYLHEKYEVGNVAIILSTSEGISKRELSRHTYVDIRMLWNLPREGFRELVHQLKPPSTIDVNTLWRLTGGNPRALIELAKLNWSKETWINIIYENKIRRAIHYIDKNKLLSLVRDPDSDWETAEKLEELGLMIELRHTAVIGKAPNPNPELGIGREWAWQIPIYKEVARKFTKS